mmetsp:Transcript_50041/g.162137  ORF Transcript_50041/g.162137 Transcript_50041/m.162137 type:complete len:337 (+) Transcript_50041:489-1499(+)
MASTQIRVHQRVGGGTPPPDGADARLWRPQRRVRCVEAVQVGPLHEDSLDVEQESDREADAEPADEGRVDESHRCALAGRQRRQWKEARDGRLILCILRVLSRGEDLGDVERGVRQHEEASEECRARDGPVDERQPGGKREEVKGPPDRNLAKVVWVARVAPQARAKEAAAKLGAERLLGAQAAVLFRLEAHHLPVCRRLASEQQEVERRRRGVECVERHVRAGRRRRGRREGEEDELLEPADEEQIEDLPTAVEAGPGADLCPAIVLAAREAALACKVGGQAEAPDRSQRREEQPARRGRRSVPVPAVEPRQDGPEAVNDGRVGGALGADRAQRE